MKINDFSKKCFQLSEFAHSLAIVVDEITYAINRSRID